MQQKDRLRQKHHLHRTYTKSSLQQRISLQPLHRSGKEQVAGAGASSRMFLLRLSLFWRYCFGLSINQIRMQDRKIAGERAISRWNATTTTSQEQWNVQLLQHHQEVLAT